MWKNFVRWLKNLFGFDDPEFSFKGVIKDDPDDRDQIFNGEVK